MKKTLQSLLITVSVVLIIACAQTESVHQSIQPTNQSSLTAEQIRIVDCLLPGKVKQLGTRRVYASRGRPIKTSALDCGIRGGEFTAYDRANINTALSVWLDSASQGDAQAQYYVGEIYEKGMGQTPNYAAAITWYTLSANQNYTPAIMSLGRLYEAGLGVEKDLVAAMNYYRKASGLSGEQIDYASVFEQARIKDQNEIKKLRQNLTQERQLSGQLSTRLNNLKGNLSNSRSKIQKLEREIKQQKTRINQPQSNTAPNGNLDTYGLQRQLAEARSALNAERTLIATLRSELELLKAGESSQQLLAGEVELARSELQKQQQAINEKEKITQRLRQQLEDLKTSIKRMSPSQQLEQVAAQLEKEKSQLVQDLKISKQELSQQGGEVEKLKLELADTNQQNVEKVNAYSLKLEQANQQLQSNQLIFDQQAQQIRLLENEISTLKIQASSMAPADQLNAVQLALSEREQQHQIQLELYKLDIEEKKNKVEILTERLSETNKANQDKTSYIADLETKISLVASDLNKKSNLVNTRTSELEQAQQTIVSLQQQIEQRPSQQEVARLESDIQLKNQALEDEKKATEKLVAEIKLLEQERDQAKSQLKKVVPEDGPVIALRWPKQQEQETGLIKKAVVGAGSVVNLVGAVYPIKTITNFTINDQPEKLDKNGLFLKSIEVSNQPLTLNMQATDDQGRVSRTSIVIEPSTEGQYAYIGGGELTVPRLNFGNYYALVIGNNNYDATQGWPPLNTAVNDAKQVAATLQDKYGFKVTLKTNVSRDELLIALEDMRKKLTENDNLLVYYAGHGHLDPANDRGYWIPVDGSNRSTTRWVSNSDITDQIRAMSARNVMVIADSCYAGSLMRSGVVTLRSGLSARKRLERLREDIRSITRKVLSAGGLQPVADALGGNHSVFANAFLNILNENNGLLDGDSLASQIGLKVAVATQDNVQQVPRYAPLSRGGHEGGEFYFVPKGWKNTNI